MHCADGRELLLTAAPELLHAALEPAAHGNESPVGEVDAALLEHLRTCGDCAALAAAILAENAALDRALAGLVLARAGARAASAARPPVAAAANVVTGSTPAVVGRRRRLRRWPAMLIPLAAAAVLLLVWRPALAPPGALPPLPGPAEEVPASPVVNAAGASAVAVMRTNDPNITVVWTF